MLNLCIHIVVSDGEIRWSKDHASIWETLCIIILSSWWRNLSSLARLPMVDPWYPSCLCERMVSLANEPKIGAVLTKVGETPFTSNFASETSCFYGSWPCFFEIRVYSVYVGISSNSSTVLECVNLRREAWSVNSQTTYQKQLNDPRAYVKKKFAICEFDGTLIHWSATMWFSMRFAHDRAGYVRFSIQTLWWV